MQLKYKFFVVDFDGTITSADCYPDIGDIKPHAVRVLSKIRECGGKIAIWTCRTGDQAERVKEYLANHGIEYDTFNDNFQEHVEEFGDRSRKVFGCVYIEDRCLFMKARGKGIDWLEVEELVFE